MAKNIRWQIPFVSIQGVHYRVDIYDEGTFTPVELTAGPTPFVTDEDASDDFFCPVRTQTGTLQVCTLKPDGTYITLDELLPANNIARPVCLLNLDNSNAIEWQGFLSCEAYSQDYTGVPQVLDLSLISVLEAMASVQADQEKITGLNTISSTVISVLESFIDEDGISYFNEFFVPGVECGRNIMSKMIDATILFDTKEYNNENSTTYIVSGLSLQDCLKRIATYMGWVVREKSGTLYFIAANDNTGYYRRYRQSQVSPGGQVTHYWVTVSSATATITQDISSLQWMGTGHQRSIEAGAKSVEVAAKLTKYNLDVSLPECPLGGLIESYRQLWNEGTSYGDWLYLLANSILDTYQHVNFAYFSATAVIYRSLYGHYQQSSLTEILDHMTTGPDSTAVDVLLYSHDSSRWYAGAFLCKYDWENSGTASAHDTKDALYCTFFPNSIIAGSNTAVISSDFDPSQVGAIFSINSIINFHCNGGYIKLSAQSDTIYFYPTFSSHGMMHSNNLNYDWYIALELKFGSQWWNGSSWQNSQCTFLAQMENSGFKSNWEESMPIVQTEGLLIPVSGSMQGDVTLKIWPMASNPTQELRGNAGILEMIFSSLSVEYIIETDSTLSDRSENHYYRLLGTNFRDEISVGTELASMLNNLPSPSLVMEDATTPMTELNYGTTQSPDMRRPEVDLLNRLAAYYGAARQRLELEVAHPTAAPLPLLKLNGINDGKVYLPLSESRDWQTNVCKLTCFELPQ